VARGRDQVQRSATRGGMPAVAPSPPSVPPPRAAGRLSAIRLSLYGADAPRCARAQWYSGQKGSTVLFFSRFTGLARDFSRSTLCMCVDFVCMCIGFGPGSPLAGHESVAESEQQRRPAASPPRSGVFCRMPAQSLSVL
jgi:hypothetical protein